MDLLRRNLSQVAHFIAETDHAYPQWQVVSTDVTALASTSLSRRDLFSILPYQPFRFESWLCNHCPDYLAPQSPHRFGSCVMLGKKREAIDHVKTECVRFLAVLPKFTFIFCRHNINDPILDVDLFLYPIFGGMSFV